MTRKHFKDLASIVRDHRAINLDSAIIMANRLAEFCSLHNPRFQSSTFKKAAGVDDESLKNIGSITSSEKATVRFIHDDVESKKSNPLRHVK